MLEFWRRMLECARESLKPTRLQGRGRVEWLSTFKCQLPSVVVHGEGKQDKLEGKNLLKLLGRETVITKGDPSTPRLCNGNKLFLGISPNNYGNITRLKSYTVEKNRITVSSVENAGYGIGFDFKVNPGMKLYKSINSVGMAYLEGFIFLNESGKMIEWTYKTTYTVPDNAVWCIAVYRGIDYEAETVWDNPVISLDSLKPYEPYCGGIPAPNPQYPIEPVFLEGASITDETNTAPLPILRALPDGSVKDEIDVVSGTVTRKLCKAYLNRIRKWYTWGVNKYGENTTGFYAFFQQNQMFKAGDVHVVSNSFIFADDNWGAKREGISVDIAFEYLIVGFKTDRLKDFSTDEKAILSFEEWIAQHPDAFFIYITGDPIIEHYDPAVLRQHPGYTQLIQQGGFREAEIEADVFPVEE